MKTIEHSYSADLSWVQHLTEQFGGKVEGNFINVPEDIHTGIRYFLECEEGIVAYYVNVKYHQDVLFTQKNSRNDFIALYYDLTEGDASLETNNTIFDIGRWKYNLAVIDGSLLTDFHVKSGSNTYALCIFIKKNVLNTFVKNNTLFFPDLQKLIDPEKNTIIRIDRIADESYHILNDLRKLNAGGPVFDLNLRATVHLLMSSYIKKIALDKFVIQTVKETDLKKIIAIQMFLTENIEGAFPTIAVMAKNAKMSESKFKNLFKKVTGLTPNSFFLNNKLLLAKELLESRQLSISQVSDKLHFSNNSYFSSKFKEHFGVSPKNYIKQL
ncbi:MULTISPECIES: helix-turn-helix transcriptional regulator [Flavobacterium]|jgi:AraC-like DNA-binding protein|uniref:AraC family transcriptional regulator n=1 Tax=Flavobacterium cupriresistens TaxID=2893885 RepID=A0ABU4RHL9_9FLAO|nr:MULTISPECIES: AraC family transcriptional regulator [unclassified Flavobacterium]MDX6191771.1 AraC family transcriptional regulator [Flavobacterium sp. Fl-318]UFH41714.1 AraC family transcriptional regulator [Flavobacterium sp. F-323]